MYFNNDTVESIVQYIKLKPTKYDGDETVQTKIQKRNTIFQNDIYKPFMQIINSLINKYKFNSIYNTKQELAFDTLGHLYQKIQHYNYNQYKNAFGFFSVIAKYFLIQRCNKCNRQSNMFIQYNQVQQEQNLINNLSENVNEVYVSVRIKSSLKIIKKVILFLKQNKHLYFKNKQIYVIQSLIFLLNQILDDYGLMQQFDNKSRTHKQLVFLLRQMTQYNKVYIQGILKKMSDILNKHFKDYNNHLIVINDFLQ